MLNDKREKKENTYEKRRQHTRVESCGGQDDDDPHVAGGSQVPEGTGQIANLKLQATVV